jgi:VanZ family protein
MAVIFWFSSRPSTDLPNFHWADRLVKKSGHMAGYALLAFWNWHGLGWKRHHRWLAWLFAMTYAVTDEYHQSFVPGRFPSVWDVLIYDNLGTLLGLWLGGKWKSVGK